VEEQDYEPLVLDPKLVHASPSRSGRRAVVIGWILVALVWIAVTVLYEVGEPAAWWDAVWYAAALLTVVSGLWLLIALIARARSHGRRAAVRWLVS
jgi:hypothetical protein